MTGFIAFIKGLVAVIMSVLHFFCPFFGDFTAATTPLKEDCRLNFAAISDIHMTDETARRDMLKFGLQDMENSQHSLDALVCAGDLTDHGEKEEWKLLAEAFADYTPAENIILAVGNHDTWTDDGCEKAQEYFIEGNKNIAGREIDKVYYSTKVNGYTFIVMGSEGDHTYATISNEQLAWLEKEMEAASEDGLPIFVISHWPINESHGLPETWGNSDPEPDDGGFGDESAQIEEILKKYENVFLISGHLHNGVVNDSQENVYNYVTVESDGSFHSVNLPSYMYLNARGRIANGTGISFEVYDEEVVLRTRSYSAGIWYTDYNFTIGLV